MADGRRPFQSFFKAVGAPDWHGKNFNAVRDSIAGGNINQIEIPYRLILKDYSLVPSAVKSKLTNSSN